MTHNLRLTILISLLLITCSLLAQQHKIDSLFSVLKTEKDDTNKVITLNKLGGSIVDMSNYSLADSMEKSAVQLAHQLGYKKGEGSAYNTIGNIYSYKGDYPNALKNAFVALQIRKEIDDKKGIASTYNNIGIDYLYQGDYTNALKNYYAALEIREKIGDKHGIASLHDNIGLIYYQQGDYANALKNSLEAQKTFDAIGDKQGLSQSDINVGNVYIKQADYENALKYYSTALKICEELEDKYSIANVYGNIGAVYYKEGDYSNALENQMTALKIREEIGEKAGIISSNINIGNALVKEKKYKEAAEYLNRAMVLGKQIGEKQYICSDYASFAMLDSATGNYKAAYEDYKNYITYNDSLKNEENTRKLVQSQMQYDFDRKEAETRAVHDKEDAVTKANKKKQGIITGAVSLGLLLVMVFAGLLFSRFRVTQKQKQIIEEQKAIVEEKNKEVLDSITYAKRLQDAILPPLSIIKKYLPESFVLYKPKDIVAGDFYWMETVGEVIFIAACDCTGHGVPGAMVSVVCSNALNRTVKEFKITEPGKILDKVRELVIETFEKSESNVQDGMDVSLCCLNTNTKELKWSGAHNALWYTQNNEIKEVAPDKQPIGKFDSQRPFTTHTLNLQKGNTLYLFTDGYADQFGGPKGKKFKYKQLSEKLKMISEKPMEVQKQMLEETLEDWKGNLEQVDDVLIMGIRI